MKYLFNILLISAILFVTGCKVQQPVIINDTVNVYTEVVRDSIIVIPPDSAFVEAWFACDSLNQVILQELNEKGNDTIIKHVTVFEKGKLTVTTLIDSQHVYLQWKERHDTTTINTTIIKEVEVEVVKYKKPTWLIALAMLGVGILAVFIITIIIKIKI